ncbi:MAG: type 4a pilus biogenesis protein PilO [Patescibacteria group bacterium]
MIRIIFPTLLLITAVAIFYFFTNPTYQETKKLTVEKKSYEDALDNSRKLQESRDKLLAKYNSFPATEIDRLERILPNNVDNVRLVLEIDRMSSKYGMPAKSINISSNTDSKKERDLIGKDNKPYGSINLEFSVEGPYSNFISFISDLERSLRIVDIESISFSASSGGIYRYNIRLKTYWLK